jgi:membrane protein AbrB duplication
MNIAITFSVGAIGAWIASKMKIPGGFIIGSLVIVAILSICTPFAEMPQVVRPFIQIVTGSYIGSGIRRADIQGMKKIIKPIIISLISIVVLMCISSFLLYSVFNFDLASALLSSVPGGVSDITLLSYELGGDVSKVAVIQTMRLSLVLAIFPPLIQRTCKKENIEHHENTVEEKKPVVNSKHIIITLVIGLIAGLIGYFLKVPAGALSFSLVATAFYSCTSNHAGVPIQMRRVVQILSGSLIGCSITMESALKFPSLLPAIVMIIILYFGGNLVVSKIMSKLTPVDRATAMFGTAPAGASDMVLIALDMDLDIDKTTVILIQITRLIVTVTIIPNLIKLILWLLL